MDPCLIATITDSIMHLGPDGNRESPRLRANNDTADMRDAEKEARVLINRQNLDRDLILTKLRGVHGRIRLNQSNVLSQSQVIRAMGLLDEVIACVELRDDTEIPESPDASRARTPETP
jgi:hypothetical protein